MDKSAIYTTVQFKGWESQRSRERAIEIRVVGNLRQRVQNGLSRSRLISSTASSGEKLGNSPKCKELLAKLFSLELKTSPWIGLDTVASFDGASGKQKDINIALFVG